MGLDLVDFAAGSVGGFAGKLFDYPLDTTKVLMQCQQGRTSVFDCVKQTVRRNGFFSLYKGITSPLLGSVAENAVLFWSYGCCQRIVQHLNESNMPLSIPQLALAGGGAGFAVSFVLTPVELVKCRMQVQNASTGNFKAFQSPLQVILYTVRNEGLVNGLYRGHTSTMLREIPGNFCYFGAYELVCKAMIPPGGTKDDLTTSAHLLGGSLSGIAYWTAFYPADTVKSLIQTRPEYANSTFVQGFTDVYRSLGIRGLYRGYSVTVARAAPSNAIIFAGYEYALKLLNGNRQSSELVLE